MTLAPERADLSPGELMSPRQRLRLVLVLGFLIALGPLTIDMYLPSLPTITGDPAHHRRRGPAHPDWHVGRAGPGSVAGRPALRRRRSPDAAAVRRRPAHPRLGVLRDRAQPGRPRHAPGAAGSRCRSRRGRCDGDRPRPLRRPAGGQAVLPADAGDGRGPDPRPDAGRHRPELDLLAWRLRRAHPVRYRDHDGDRALPARDAAGRQTPQRWGRRHPARLRPPVLGPRLPGPDHRGRPGHVPPCSPTSPAPRSSSRSSTA